MDELLSVVDEKEVFPGEIPDTLEALDFDEGMRVRDSSGRIAFITRSSGEFCINVSKDSGEEWFYAERSSEAYDILREQLKEPLRAWLY